MNNIFKVGISRQDITPKVGCCLYGYRPDLHSEYVLDNLTLTTFAFSYGDKKALMITLCVCSMATNLCDELRNEIAFKTGILPQNILISCTHTHSGPALNDSPGWGGIDYEYYNEILKPKVLLSCSDAIKKWEKATVGIASGKSKIGINRRYVREDNTIALGQNPWGPYNPEMTVISFKGEKGNILGHIIHYGMHGTCAGSAAAISRDWSGIMVDELEKTSGGYAGFFNGPEGDVGPRLSNGRTTGVSDVKYIKEIGDIAAEDAIKIYNSTKEFTDISFDIASTDLNLPVQPRTPLETSKFILSILDPNTVNSPRLVYEHFRETVESYKTDFVEVKTRAVPQTVVKIGNVVFASTPFELFSEIGMRIDKADDQYKVLTLALTNGSEGYFPTQDQMSRISYESRSFKVSHLQPFTEDADYYLMNETLRNIKSLEKE